MAAAVCNAAACKGKGERFSAFLVLLAKELGVKLDCEGLEHVFLKDVAFQFTVPRFLFPGVRGLCDTGSLIGFVKRMKNKDRFNVKITLPAGDVISLEVKDQESFGNKDLWIVATKLFSTDDQRIGLLIVRQCCSYWGQVSRSNRSSTNLERVKTFLSALKGEKVGDIYFIRSDGVLSHHKLGPGLRRLILIQVGC